MHHIGIGRTHARTRIILLIHNLDIRIIHATTGEILRDLTLTPPAATKAPAQNHPAKPSPEGSRCRLCLATSHGAPSRIRTCDTRFRKFLQARNPKIRITRGLLTKVLTVREIVKSWHSSESIRLYPVSAESRGIDTE